MCRSLAPRSHRLIPVLWYDVCVKETPPPVSFSAILWGYQPWAQKSLLGGLPDPGDPTRIPPASAADPHSSPMQWLSCHYTSPTWARLHEGRAGPYPSVLGHSKHWRISYVASEKRLPTDTSSSTRAFGPPLPLLPLPEPQALRLCHLKMHLLSIECLPCTKHCPRYGGYNVNKTDKSPWACMAYF